MSSSASAKRPNDPKSSSFLIDSILSSKPTTNPDVDSSLSKKTHHQKSKTAEMSHNNEIAAAQFFNMFKHNDLSTQIESNVNSMCSANGPQPSPVLPNNSVNSLLMGFSLFPAPIRNYLLKAGAANGFNQLMAMANSDRKSGFEMDEATASSMVYRSLLNDSNEALGFQEAQNVAAAAYNQFVNMNGPNGNSSCLLGSLQRPSFN